MGVCRYVGDLRSKSGTNPLGCSLAVKIFAPVSVGIMRRRNHTLIFSVKTLLSPSITILSRSREFRS